MEMKSREEIMKTRFFSEASRLEMEVLLDIRDLLNLLVYPKYKLTPEDKIERVGEG